MSLFIDSGVGLALSMVRFTFSTEWQKQAYGYKTNNVRRCGIYWTDESIVYMFTGIC